jgi:PAT family beta-lactamase induction signal transducer AmpG
VLPMREAPGPARLAVVGSRLASAGRQMRDFAVDSFRSFLGTRGAFSGLFFALLPPGAMCLGLALQSNLAVELGMDDDQVAWLNLWSAIISAGFCVLGGYLSDRYGRRRMLFSYIALMGLPVLYLMNVLTQHGWIMPVSAGAAGRPEVPAALLTAFWVACLVYAMFNGLMYGTRSAIFMDVTNPAVAATQFTAYMALMNLAISYSATWQGIAIEAWGYPRTMLIDTLFGAACLLIIPFMKRTAADGEWTDALASSRARVLACALALGCFAWLPYSHWHEAVGAAQPIAGTLFTLVFVGSALFLLAGAAVLRETTGALARAGRWVAPLLLLMYARYHGDTIAGWLPSDAAPALLAGARVVFDIVPPLGGALLLLYALRPWHELRATAAAPAPAGGAAAVRPAAP